MDGAMRQRWWRAALIACLLGLIEPSSPHGESPDPQPYQGPLCFHDEVAALLDIKAELNDPDDVLHDWMPNSDDPCPCLWKAVACLDIDDTGFRVFELNLARLGLSGTLSPKIGNLESLRVLQLQGNTISGPIPETIGSLALLQKLDMSNNNLNGSIPSSLGDLKRLYYLKLNNNSLSGVVPDSLGTISYLDTLDLSFNNLSSPLPNISAGVFNITGNPLICRVNLGYYCSHDQTSTAKALRLAAICVAAVCSVVLVTVFGMHLIWWRYMRTKKILPAPT